MPKEMAFIQCNPTRFTRPCCNASALSPQTPIPSRYRLNGPEFWNVIDGIKLGLSDFIFSQIGRSSAFEQLASFPSMT